MTMQRIDHTAVAVHDLEEAIGRYERIYGAKCRERDTVPEQGVEIAFLRIGDTQLELITPLDEESGVARFLAKRGEALHHIAVRVDDIAAEIDRLSRDGAELIDRAPRRGAHGLVAFVHPRSAGVLLELIQPA